MKGNELRIGNLVYVPATDQIVPVTSIHNIIGLTVNDSLAVIGFDEIEPVPITEEWLLKFDFKNYGNFELVSEKYSISFDDGKLWVGEIYDRNAVLIHSETRYVHQLQNIYFALTGEEPKLKSPSE